MKSSVLDSVMARLWKRTPFTDPILALEIIDGEWKGVVFYFKTFALSPQKLENGMTPARFEIEILQMPDTLPPDWTPTEEFDAFASELLIAWLSYLNTNTLVPLIRAVPHGGIQ